MIKLNGLYFVRLVHDPDDPDNPDVMYGQVIDSTDSVVLLSPYSVLRNEPLDELDLELIETMVSEAKFFRTLELARAKFIEMTRDETCN
jgi:hypothetical protein